jgi:hypothetical protein
MRAPVFAAAVLLKKQSGGKCQLVVLLKSKTTTVVNLQTFGELKCQPPGSSIKSAETTRTPA